MSETNSHSADIAQPAYESAYNQATKSERRARVGRRAAMAGGGLALLAAGAGLLGSGHAQGEAKVADLAGAGVAVAAAAGSRKIAEHLDASEQRHGSNAAALGHQQVRSSIRTGSETPVWAAKEVIEATAGTGRHEMPEAQAVTVGNPADINIAGFQSTRTTYETPAGNVHVDVFRPTSPEQLLPSPNAQQLVSQPQPNNNPGA